MYVVCVRYIHYQGFWLNGIVHLVALGDTCNGLSLILFLFSSNLFHHCSLDSRGGGSLKQATHSALASDLGQRLYFSAENNPKDARLQIKNVILSDGGVYRCRVDFFNAATRNLRVNLSLVGKCILSLIFFPDLFNMFGFIFVSYIRSEAHRLYLFNRNGWRQICLFAKYTVPVHLRK